MSKTLYGQLNIEEDTFYILQDNTTEKLSVVEEIYDGGNTKRWFTPIKDETILQEFLLKVFLEMHGHHHIDLPEFSYKAKTRQNYDY